MSSTSKPTWCSPSPLRPSNRASGPLARSPPGRRPPFHLGFDVVPLEADVVQPFPPSSEESGQRPARLGRLEQLNLVLAGEVELHSDTPLRQGDRLLGSQREPLGQE